MLGSGLGSGASSAAPTPSFTPIRTRPKGFGLAHEQLLRDGVDSMPTYGFGAPLPTALSPGVSSAVGIRTMFDQSPPAKRGRRPRGGNAHSGDDGGMKGEAYLQWLGEKRQAEADRIRAMEANRRLSLMERLALYGAEAKREAAQSELLGDAGRSATVRFANESNEKSPEDEPEKWRGRKVSAAPQMPGRTARVKKGGWNTLKKIVRHDSVQQYARPPEERGPRWRKTAETKVKTVQEYEDIHSKTSFHDDHFRRDDKAHRDARNAEHMQIMRRHRYDRDWMRKERYDMGERPDSPRKRFMGKCHELGLVPPEILVPKDAEHLASHEEGTLNIEGFGLGNQILLALSESVGRMELHTLNIAANRATDNGLKTLLSELADAKHLETLTRLDLSRNKLGRGSVSKLDALVSSW